MKTKTFLSNQYKTIQEFDEDVQLYASSEESGGFEVEITTCFSSVALSSPVKPDIIGARPTAVNINIIALVCKVVNSYEIEDDEYDNIIPSTPYKPELVQN